jgi:maleylacetoacetate isomerase
MTSASTVPMKLYSYFRSSASYRVRIALNLKGLPYEILPVHLIEGGGQQHAESYRRLNPSREVPTLVHGDFILGQSMAIIDYLDSVQFSPRLIPVDPQQRAITLQACEIVNSGAQPVHNLRVLQKLEKDFQATQDQRDAWSASWIRYGCETLESFLADKAGRFAMGDHPTAADCFVIPHLANADRFKVSLEAFPTLRRIRVCCLDLPAFQNAAPEKQPDFPRS